MQKYAFLTMMALSAMLHSPLTYASDCPTRLQQLEQQAAQPNANRVALQPQINQALARCERTIGLYILNANIHSQLAQWSSAIQQYELALNYLLAVDPAGIATKVTTEFDREYAARKKITTEVELRLSILSSALRIPNRPLASDHLLKLRKLQQSPHLSTQLVASIQQYDLALSEDLSLRPLQTQEMVKAAAERDLVYEPVQLSYRIAFALNADQLDASAKKVLAGMIEALRVPDVKKITIIGHTDQQGDTAYNQRLSERRAKAIMNWLIQQAPDLTAKLHTEGRGESNLLSTGHTETDHAQNRRVEFQIGN